MGQCFAFESFLREDDPVCCKVLISVWGLVVLVLVTLPYSDSMDKDPNEADIPGDLHVCRNARLVIIVN